MGMARFPANAMRATSRGFHGRIVVKVTLPGFLRLPPEMLIQHGADPASNLNAIEGRINALIQLI